jgi:hypothetical protein
VLCLPAPQVHNVENDFVSGLGKACQVHVRQAVIRGVCEGILTMSYAA